MGWLELPGHEMRQEVAHALVAPGLGTEEPLEHLAWGGELPTWDSARRGLGRLGRGAAEQARQIRPREAVGAVVELGATFALLETLRAIGVTEPELILEGGGATSAPAPSRLGFLVASTPSRLILLEVQRTLLEARGRVRTLVAVHSAFWWARPLPAGAALEMKEGRALWKQTVLLTFADEDGGERLLSFPAQPGFQDNLGEARAIAGLLR